MDIIITDRNIEVTCRRVKATMSQSQKRGDLGWVCGKIKENGGRAKWEFLEGILGIDNAQAMVLVDNLKYLKLVDKNSTLTKMGIIAAENGEVFIPEEGVYYTWEVEGHPLFKNNRFIHWLLWSGPPHTRRDIEKRGYPEKTMKSLVNSDMKSREWNVDVRGDTINKYAGSLSLVEWKWIVNKWKKPQVAQTIRVKGKISVPLTGKYKNPDSNVPINSLLTSPIPRSYENVEDFMGELFLDEGYRWDREREALGIKLEDCDVKERERFSKNLSKKQHTYLNQKYDVKINDVNIVPRNNREAKKWLEWYFEERFTQHFTDQGQRIIIDEIKTTTPLGTFECDIDLGRLRDKYQKRVDGRYWYLVAGDDLTLKKSGRKVQRISSGEELTYGEAFCRLFPGLNFKDGKNLVYMDKHLFESYNVGRTERLIRALGECGYAGKINLVTKAWNKPKLSKKYPNVKIRDYDNVYSDGIRPHGRYFFIDTISGGHFFDLTHNLFHPTDIKGEKMSWNDISSQRFTIEEIENDPTRGKILGVK